MFGRTGRRRALSVFSSTLVALGVAVLAAPGAQAAAYPTTDTLRDAAGNASDCVATAVAPRARPRTGTFAISVYGTCVTGWERIAIDMAIIEVLPGGAQVAIVPRGRIAVTTDTSGGLVDLGAGAHHPCSPGTHTYIGRWYPKVKHGVSDPNPFKATVQARATITCS